MSAQDRAIQKLARELAGIKKEVVSWRGPQADYTSIENGGNFTFKDSDGNVTAVVGGQDDGSNTIRHVDGPTPMVPAGLTAHVDGPIIQTEWDGTFEDNATPTFDHSHLEVEATGPGGEKLRGSLNDITGGVVAFTATVSGEWTVVARSVSRAEKRSLDGDAGTVTVEIVGLSGAINDAIGSANGKNTVTYSEDAPTPADEGIVGDTWWVGQVGRPNDIIEGTNLARNPGAHPDGTPWGWSGGSGVTATMSNQVRGGLNVARATYTAGSAYLYLTSVADYSNPANMAAVVPGTVISARMLVASSVARSLSLRIGFRTSSGGFAAWSVIGPSVSVPADGDLVELKIEGQTVPVGAAFAYVHATSAAGVGTWVEGTRAMFEVSPTVSPYFDGDTTSGVTDNEPHYRWTGTTHASASEKYLPAIPDLGSDSWNITEQWQYTSAGWKPVEVSHQVIATVDLGKATVGELDGIRIMGQTVRGEQLSGDAIDGKVITGGTYRTTGGTGSWSDDGLFIAQPDGTSMVRFPTDGSPLSLTASDVQIDRASITDLDLSLGSVRSGGQVALASGVTAPASPPELTTGWQKVCTLKPVERGRHDWVGLAYWEDSAGGKFWVRTVNYLGTGENDSIELYDHDTGAYARRILIDCDPRNGLTVMGDIVYVFGGDHGAGNAPVIDGYNLVTGARVSRHSYTRAIQAQNALGNDGTNLIVASVYNRRLWVHYRNPVTGVQFGPDMLSGELTWPAADASNLYGVSINAAGTEITVVPTVAARVYTISGGTLTHKPDPANANGLAGWTNPNKSGAGMVRRGAFPFVVDGVGDVYRGSNIASDITVQACFTWWDGTHETTPSPIAEIVLPAQSDLKSTLPVRAGLQKRLYLNIGGWYWTAVDADQTVAHGLQPTGMGAPPTTNTFPNADPATLNSTNDKFEVSGDGSGHWGPLTFNADGTMTSTQIPSWVPITSFTSGFSAQTWGYVPSYRIWPDGKVEWRGVVAGTIDGTMDIFTIPLAARPAQAVNTVGASTSAAVSSLVKRIEFRPNKAPTMCRVYRGDADSTWVSLDNISYYTS